MTIWLTIVGMALATLATRLLPLLVLRATLPGWLAHWLGYVPVAVFTALIVPALLVRDGTAGPFISVGPALPAGIVGAVVAWRGGGVLATIAAGLLVFWLMRWLG